MNMLSELLYTGIGFFIFLIFHVVSLRCLSYKQSVYAVFKTLALSWIGALLAGFLLGFGGFTFVVLLTLSVCIYVLGVFTIADSSIHIRLLVKIAQSGSHGITKKELLKQYNRETILQKRLKRLVESGEILQSGRIYRLVKSTSLLTVREKISRFIEFLFP